jgi:hypothetical protein
MNSKKYQPQEAKKEMDKKFCLRDLWEKSNLEGQEGD